MADIRPFQGIHYNEELIQELSAVICPPHDIISPRQQDELYQNSEHNFIRLEYGRELPQDTATDNRYTRSTTTMEEWLNKGILVRDNVPAIYLHDYYFTHQGIKYKRRSIIARVMLEEWDKGIIRPHEGTMTEPRGDRLSLLRALQANTSPILALFEDRNQQISPLLSNCEQSKPLIQSNETGEESHRVWAVTDAETLDRISSSLAGQTVYVADGHHRYESALVYRLERSVRSQSDSGEEPYNFVMMELVELSDPGLLILAPHRLVRGIPKPVRDKFRTELEVFFEIEEFPLNPPDIRRQVKSLLGKTEDITCILFGLSKEHLHSLRLRDPAAADQMMPYLHSELYRKLDVSIIDHVIMDKMLGLTSEKEKTGLTFSHDIAEAVNRILDQEYQMAFLLRPVTASKIKDIADIGERMPRKSTYFHPKAPAGLILNRLA